MQHCTLIPDSQSRARTPPCVYAVQVGAVRVTVRAVALNLSVARLWQGYRSHTTHSMKAQLRDIVH